MSEMSRELVHVARSEFKRPEARGDYEAAWLPEFLMNRTIEGMGPDTCIHLPPGSSWISYDRLSGGLWLKTDASFNKQQADFSHPLNGELVLMRVFQPDNELDGFVLDARELQAGELFPAELTTDDDNSGTQDRYALYREKNKFRQVAAALFTDPDGRHYPAGDIRYYSLLSQLASRIDQQKSETIQNP